jgi:DNA ligase-1
MTEPIEVHEFQTLFGKDIKGKTKTWKLKVEKYTDYSVIVTLYGYSKLIETRRQINSGKNINKANKTTHFTQAIAEANSKWIKKRDIEQFKVIDNVKENVNEKEVNVNKENVNEKELIVNEKELIVNFDETTLPMLAQDYKKQYKKLKYPCYVQCKLDGFRMIYNTTTGKITTRQGKEYNIIKESGKLYEELQKLPKGLILDGELYTNKVNFEELGVLRKTKKLTKEELDNLCKIEYHIYDLIDTKLVFEERIKKIKDLLIDKYAKLIHEKLIYVETFLVKNEEEIKNYHTIFLEQGYEGTMVRNKDSFYKIKQRSSDLLKYKDFQDSEFKIIDYTLEKDTSGADENLIVWVINVPVKQQFIKCKVRPMGTKEERKDLYKKCVENFDQFKGRNLWTKFFEYTADGNLRFPCTFRSTYTEYIRDTIE